MIKMIQQQDENKPPTGPNPMSKTKTDGYTCAMLARNIKVIEKVNKEGYYTSEPPWISRRKLKFSLGKFDVPRSIRDAILKGNLEKLELGNELTPENYVGHFQTLLYVEEIHHVAEMMRYELPKRSEEGKENKIRLTPFGSDNRYSLLVPGLEDRRPSLIAGDKVVLRSQKIVGGRSNYIAYIHQVREQDVIIKLDNSAKPNIVKDMHFKVVFVSSRTPFLRAHHATIQFGQGYLSLDALFPNKLVLSKNLKDPLFDIRETPINFNCFHKGLNEFQRQAVVNILKSTCRPMPYILFGPPGTGKTLTLVEAILQIRKRNPRAKILACSNSNVSADHIATKIKSSEVIPLDQYARVSAFYRFTLPEKNPRCIPESIKDISRAMDEVHDADWENYKVVITTCIQAGAFREFGDDLFDYVFIDEAGYAQEPEALIALSLLKPGGVAVLAGDPYQLPPIVMSPIAKSYGLDKSIMKRLYDRVVDSDEDFDNRFITSLKFSYRCDPRLMEISNREFYRGELIFKISTPKKWLDFMKFSHPCVFAEVKGSEVRNYLNPSYYNPKEAIACLRIIHKLMGYGMKKEQIGLMTPYRQQIVQMMDCFKETKTLPCKVGTMEEFQGIERDVIIISTVRTKKEGFEFKKFEQSFLTEPKRFNVGISRARWIVIVVGDPEILKLDRLWEEFVDNCKSKGSYINESVFKVDDVEVIKLAEDTKKPKEIPKWVTNRNRRRNKKNQKAAVAKGQAVSLVPTVVF